MNFATALEIFWGVFLCRFCCERLVAEVQTLVLHEAGFVALRHFSPSLCCHETWKRESLNTPSEFNPGATGILKADSKYPEIDP